MTTLNVVATDGLDSAAVKKLEPYSGIRLKVEKGVEASRLREVLKDADLVIIRSATRIDSALMQELPILKGVLRAGVGLDNVDVEAATQKGLWVWNAPTGNFQATAELAMGMIFSLARQIPQATQGAREGKWLKKEISSQARQLAGSTLGVLGAGNIGRRVARMARGCGMHVLVCDPLFQPQSDEGFESVDFPTLLKMSDFLTVHVPLLKETRGLFNKATFAQMKPTAFLVNCARGGIVDEKALLEVLEAGTLAGAALDVFEKEPFSKDEPHLSRLLSHPRLVATPHVGASTLESQKAVSLECAEKILGLFQSLESSDVPAPRALNRPVKARWSLRMAPGE